MRAEVHPVYDAMRQWLDGEPVPPLAAFFDRFGRSFRNYRLARNRTFHYQSLEQSGRLYAERAMCIGAYGFALPCAELIAACVKNSPLVEIGAGSGALARLIANAGGGIVATDANDGALSYGFEIGKWFPVATGIDGAVAVRAHPKSTVLCSWPSLRETWFKKALIAMRPGQGIIAVREDACADDGAWNYFDGPRFADTGTIEIPCWYGMHDIAEGRRKRRRDDP